MKNSIATKTILFWISISLLICFSPAPLIAEEIYTPTNEFIETDSDGDGIYDSEDPCVDDIYNLCQTSESNDYDFDGIANHEDPCPLQNEDPTQDGYCGDMADKPLAEVEVSSSAPEVVVVSEPVVTFAGDFNISQSTEAECIDPGSSDPTQRGPLSNNDSANPILAALEDNKTAGIDQKSLEEIHNVYVKEFLRDLKYSSITKLEDGEIGLTD